MSRKSGKGKILAWLVIVMLAVGGFLAYKYFLAGINLGGKNYVYLFIERDENYDDVTDKLVNMGIVKDKSSFGLLAKTMRLPEKIFPGRYRINDNMSIRQIINMLRNNRQEKVKLSYNWQIMTLDKFFEYTDEKLELDADDLEEALEDGEWLDKNFGLDLSCCFAAIVPGTYEVSWAITGDELLKMLKDRYQNLWTPARIALAQKLKLSKGEVTILASIVQSESSIKSEQEKIAGVYLNRLKANMILQADPTLRFLSSGADRQRVLDVDKEVDSPYNTYKYKGLPPGPICLVYPQSIDATLNYVKHKFMYFCAKPDLNGYSDFVETYEEHRKNAAAYHDALDRRGIVK